MSRLLWLSLPLTLLFPVRADAGCGGLHGADLVQCQQADSQMRQNYFVQQAAAEKIVLHFTFNGTPFTLTAAQFGGDYIGDVCQVKGKPGNYAQLDPKTSQAVETTTCGTVKKNHPRNAMVVPHGPYKNLATHVEGTYWCGWKIGEWTTGEKGGAVQTQTLTINDLQADCDAPPLKLKLVKLAMDRWTLQ